MPTSALSEEYYESAEIQCEYVPLYCGPMWASAPTLIFSNNPTNINLVFLVISIAYKSALFHLNFGCRILTHPKNLWIFIDFSTDPIKEILTFLTLCEIMYRLKYKKQEGLSL